jgi:chemotaxis family two-component system sensor kinase Cph1
MNHWRFIADARQGVVPLVPETCSRTGHPLDLTYAALRGITPAQSRHLSKMGVAAAMAVAIVREGSLWGLISCHHSWPRKLPFATRTACDFLADVLSVQTAARERASDYQQRIELKTVQHRILAAMAGADPFINRLTRNPDDLLCFARAQGAAVLFEGECTRVGRTPDEAAIQQLVDWLVEHGREDVFCTDSLPAMLEDGERYREHASGVLALSLSGLHRTYVLWFRPEAHTIPRRPAARRPSSWSRTRRRCGSPPLARWRKRDIGCFRRRTARRRSRCSPRMTGRCGWC